MFSTIHINNNTNLLSITASNSLLNLIRIWLSILINNAIQQASQQHSTPYPPLNISVPLSYVLYVVFENIKTITTNALDWQRSINKPGSWSIGGGGGGSIGHTFSANHRGSYCHSHFASGMQGFSPFFAPDAHGRS
ncbi:hypothetical protein ACJX0J_010437, partial [Zea mays]